MLCWHRWAVFVWGLGFCMHAGAAWITPEGVRSALAVIGSAAGAAGAAAARELDHRSLLSAVFGACRLHRQPVLLGWSYAGTHLTSLRIGLIA